MPNTVQERNEALLEQEKRNSRLSAIQSEMRELADKAKAEERDFTDDEKAKWLRHKGEFDRLVEERKRNEALEGMDQYIEQNRSIRDELDRGGDGGGGDLRFDNFGEFVREVAAAGGYGRPTEKRDILISNGNTGGSLVPAQFMDTIMQVDPARAIVRPRATVIPPGERPEAPFSIPYFDQDTEDGGIDDKPRAEDEEMSESSPEFGLLTLEPKERSSYVEVSKKSLDNITAIGAFLERRFRLSREAKEDRLFLLGSGISGPKGIHNAGAAISVDRNTTGQIKFADVAAMMAAQMDFFGGVWLANQYALPSIVKIADDNGNSIFISGDAARGIPQSLLGYPILWSSRVPTLGETGDLSFVNFSYYIIKDGSGPYIEVYDVQPKKRLITFTSTWNVDADLWLKSTITREDGNEYSPVIKLAA